ncbi:zinc-binding dehydrogenase [uncultured Sphingomonas sp.]|uniref:zinc-binding dehydrogenase n=1 Tax=uncultured Sphingomonas sp. TaxID=158754 RepID=UPI0035CB76A0
MTGTTITSGLELRSLVTAAGRLEVSLVDVPVPTLGSDEVLVRIEAAPINPSDLGLLLGPADVATIRAEGGAGRPKIVADVPSKRLIAIAARLDESMPVGNEGAGTVIDAGENARHLIGRTVAVLGGAMYAQYCVIRAGACLVLPDGTTAREGASAYVNPLTALSMVEVMRREGHTALVHTAAASNLGQMLNRICIADGVPLVNIVRSSAQADILREIGAAHVVDSTADGFLDTLTDALEATGATLAFDAVGGGQLAGQIIGCMEAALLRKPGAYSRYGSPVQKQVYIYGVLDMAETRIGRNVGMAWGIGGFLLTYFLAQIAPADAKRMRQRVADELTTTFASRYTAEISLTDALKPEVLAAYARRATGEKYLINPTLDQG